MADADLASLPAESKSSRPVPDMIAHRVVYGGLTITATDDETPQKLGPLVGRLSTLVDRYSKR